MFRGWIKFLGGLFHWQIEHYGVFSSICNSLKLTLSEEKPMKNDFKKINSLCVDSFHGLWKMTNTTKVSDFVEKCEIGDDTRQSTKRKIFNVEHTNTWQRKSTSQKIYRLRKKKLEHNHEVIGKKTKNNIKISNVGENYKKASYNVWSFYIVWHILWHIPSSIIVWHFL